MWDKKWFQFIILILLAFVWGSSFILMKIGLISFASDQAAAIRMLLASLTLSPLAIKHIRSFNKKDLRSLLVAGFIGSFIPAFLFMKAQTQIDSAIAGILNSLTPVFTLVIGALFYRVKIRWQQGAGLILGLLGAFGLVTANEGLDLGKINLYALLIVLATTFYGINVNEVKARLTHLTGIQITAFSFMFIGPVSLIYLATTDLNTAFNEPKWPFHLLALAVLGIIGTASAMLLMNSLIRRVSPIFAASVTYIIPIFAIMWGILDGEHITPFHLLCMAVILVGIYLINQRKKKK